MSSAPGATGPKHGMSQGASRCALIIVWQEMISTLKISQVHTLWTPLCLCQFDARNVKHDPLWLSKTAQKPGKPQGVEPSQRGPNGPKSAGASLDDLKKKHQIRSNQWFSLFFSFNSNIFQHFPAQIRHTKWPFLRPEERLRRYFNAGEKNIKQYVGPDGETWGGSKGG